MKYMLITLFAALLLGGCGASNAKLDAEHVDLVKNYIAAVETMDYDAMDQFLAEDYIGLGPSYGDTIYKTQAIENWKANVTNLYKKIHYNRSKTAPVYIADGAMPGHWVGNWAELEIEYLDGNKVTIWANTNYLIRDKKIVRSLTFYNEADALRQLGYVFVPATASE
jgi:hypothetical protein